MEFPNHPQKRFREACGTKLLKRVKRCNENKVSYYPLKVYSYRPVFKSFEDLLAKPGFLQSLRSRREPYDDVLYDILDGELLRNFTYVVGTKFFDDIRNIAFMMNFDFFNPFKNSQYSLGVLYLAVINLPREIRNLWENIIIVGVIPGPEEPKNDINPFLRRMVDDHIKGWNGLDIEENGIPFLYKFALVCISNDIPATRKCVGFLGHMAKKGNLLKTKLIN